MPHVALWFKLLTRYRYVPSMNNHRPVQLQGWKKFVVLSQEVSVHVIRLIYQCSV